jgi:hypothetical protein
MCGRYRRTTREEELARIYRIPIPAQPDLGWAIASVGQLRLISSVGFSARLFVRPAIFASLLLILGAGCAQSQKMAKNPPKKQWNGVQFGPATYNQWTHDFEEPWPWGPGGGP